MDLPRVNLQQSWQNSAFRSPAYYSANLILHQSATVLLIQLTTTVDKLMPVDEPAAIHNV